MKEKIRSLDVRLTELSKYLGISRPTLYRYLELYESGEAGQVPKDIRDLFRFIDNRCVSKDQLMRYVVSHFCMSPDDGIKTELSGFINESSERSPKLKLMHQMATTSQMDPLIGYLTECISILERDDISDEELVTVARFVLFRSAVSKGVGPTGSEIEEARAILGCDYNEDRQR